MPTRPALAVLLLAALCACKKDDAKPGKTPADAAAVAVARPADAGAKAPPPATGDAGATTPAGDSGDAGAKSPPPGDGEGDEKPTNLKVLPRTLTMKQVSAEMKTYAKALGVKCDFCHVKDDFASDDIKEKGEGRKMIAMTRDLNKQFFKGKNEVACFTCHQGAKKPAAD